MSNRLNRLFAIATTKTLVEYERNDCLTHKLCKKLLQRKWLKYGLPFHIFQMIMFLVFLASITFIVVAYPLCVTVPPENAKSVWMATKHVTPDNETQFCYNYGYTDLASFKSNWALPLIASFCILYSLVCIFNIVIAAYFGIKNKIAKQCILVSQS